MKAATLFSGFEGVGIGMRAAGLQHAWGLEYDPQIAEVARMNGFNIQTQDILRTDPALLERVEVLHASPPCPNFSVAKAGAHETENDLALARKVADFVEILRPKVFTLENVYKYRLSESWQIIATRLYSCGYWVDMVHGNMADYGVPQTRQRMIVRAVHHGMVPYLPPAQPWQGWYQAIEDLIPTLPPSKFADWQLARLPNELRESFIMGGGGNTNFQDAKPGKGLRLSSEPTETITTGFGGGTVPRAWLINSENAGQEWGGTRFGEQPAMSTSSKPKAFIMSGDNASNFQREEGTIRNEAEPVFTIRASANKGLPRAWLSLGHVVKMTPRALARFQTFPDDYKLPEKTSLACKGIGNAVPALFAEKMYKSLLEVIHD